MATEKLRIIHHRDREVKNVHSDNWQVMKPFVKFSFGAIKVMHSL